MNHLVWKHAGEDLLFANDQLFLTADSSIVVVVVHVVVLVVVVVFAVIV